jgi:putative spermidine/putrescine transport system substrate-binding protein
LDVPLTASQRAFVSEEEMRNLIYPDWSKINPRRAGWSAQFDRTVRR